MAPDLEYALNRLDDHDRLHPTFNVWDFTDLTRLVQSFGVQSSA